GRGGMVPSSLSVAAARRNTASAINAVTVVSCQSSTTNTGTSTMRSMVSTFGRFHTTAMGLSAAVGGCCAGCSGVLVTSPAYGTELSADGATVLFHVDFLPAALGDSGCADSRRDRG